MRGRLGWCFLGVFLAGSAVRTLGVSRPLDSDSWREADLAGIARTYYREGIDLIHPRVDWRGEGPGYVEMEFPFLPWGMAALSRTLGYSEGYGRWLSLVASVGALATFLGLARRLLPPAGALAAVAFFALGPLVLEIATSVQPDGLMLLFLIAAASSFLRWVESGTRSSYFTAAAATALALLAKASAAHIGLFFLAVLVDRRGWKAVTDPRLWAFGALTCLPAILWYGHAHSLWLRYGNSLGISNESHWVGWDFFTDPYFVSGILRHELLRVWMPPGLAVGALALYQWKGTPGVRDTVYWLGAVFVYYGLAARTTADNWSVYYHAVSVPPAALLFGAGVETLRQHRTGLPSSLPPLRSRAVVPLGLFCALLAILLEGRLAWHQVTEQGEHPLRGCARSMAPLVPDGQLVLATGGHCRDENGYPVAYNASYMFLWLDRKGFNICREEQSIDVVRSFASRGAAVMVAEKETSSREFGEALARTFPRLGECPAAWLYDIRR